MYIVWRAARKSSRMISIRYISDPQESRWDHLICGDVDQCWIFRMIFRIRGYVTHLGHGILVLGISGIKRLHRRIECAPDTQADDFVSE